MTRRETLNEALTKRRYALAAIDEIRQHIAETDSEVAVNLHRQEIARKSAKLVQDHLATKLSGIVTRALSTVFDEDIQFVAQFIERRGVSECDLFLRIGDYEYDILKGQGGGIADVCSICLQMAFITMSQVNRILVVDEPARHMDAGAAERFTAILQELCRELSFTIIMVTHSQAFIDGADKVFKVTKRGGISYVN